VVRLQEDYDGIDTRAGLWRAGAHFNLGKMVVSGTQLLQLAEISMQLDLCNS
jgi:hypothetical protein